MTTTTPVRDNRIPRWEAVLMAGLLIVTFIPFLSETLFTTKGEPREAVVAVSMLNQGNWILPVSFGADIPYKPPMLAWCVAFLGWLNGGVVTEFLSRVPSALAAIAMILSMFGFLCRRVGSRTAFMASLVTAGAFEVFRSATICRVDMLLTAFVVMAILALYRHWERRPQGTWLPSVCGALLMSGAVLTKGPVGMLLPCMVLFVFRLAKGGGFWQTAVSLFLSGLLSLVLPALWYLAAYARGGEEFLSLVMEENFGRFTGGMSYSSHEHSIFYNFTSLLSGMAPYTLLLIISLFWRPWRGVSKVSRNIFMRVRAMDAVELLSLLATVLIFVFYCIPKSKRSVYLLPMYPFMGYFVAVYINRLVAMAPVCLKVYGWILASLGAAASVGLLLVITGIVPPFGHGSTGLMTALLSAEGSRVLPPLMCYVALFGALSLATVLLKGVPRAAVTATAIYSLVIYWMVQASALPAAMNYKSDRDMAYAIAEAVDDNETLYSYRSGNMERFFTIDYYLSDRLHRFEVENPSSGLLLVSEGDLQSLAEQEGTGYNYITVAELGRSGEAKTNLLLVRFSR